MTAWSTSGVPHVVVKMNGVIGVVDSLAEAVLRPISTSPGAREPGGAAPGVCP
ncbi:hypothetical protein [Xylanimonas allomyrinae]|uniref:hypothetical protein n=1 Tax=Xylanimonas allomyrinae TaxID=2509459 RepID=UPI0013A6581C|nr:hypothetical protein [Xylanimonas allomyrinae]